MSAELDRLRAEVERLRPLAETATVRLYEARYKVRVAENEWQAATNALGMAKIAYNAAAAGESDG